MIVLYFENRSITAGSVANPASRELDRSESARLWPPAITEAASTMTGAIVRTTSNKIRRNLPLKEERPLQRPNGATGHKGKSPSARKKRLLWPVRSSSMLGRADV